MEAEPDVLAASVESTSEKKVWPELALWKERMGCRQLSAHGFTFPVTPRPL